MWKEVANNRSTYEAGFETSKAEYKSVARRDVYADRKQSQTLSPHALELVSRRLSHTFRTSHVSASTPVSSLVDITHDSHVLAVLTLYYYRTADLPRVSFWWWHDLTLHAP